MWVQLALYAAQMWLGEITRPRPKRIGFEEFAKNNAPSEVRPIPYIGGTVEIAPSRIWYGDYSQRAVERDSNWFDYVWAGPLAFLLDTITVAYRYYVGEIFALNFGPDTHVERVTIDDRPVYAALQGLDNAGGGFLIDDPQAWGGDQPPGQGGQYSFCRITRGNYTDPTDSYVQSQLATLPNRAPATHGVSCLISMGRSGATESGYFAAGGVGYIPKLRLWKVVVRRQPDNLQTGFNKLGRHMNPAETIYEWSTSLEYGAKAPVTELNIPSLQAGAQQLYEESNGDFTSGWSGRIESETQPVEVVRNVLAQIDGVLDPSPSLGLTLRLIRRDYSIPSLRILTQDEITSVDNFAPGTVDDTVNKIIVPFEDQNDNFKPRPGIYIDPANQLLQDGRIVPQTQDYLGVGDFPTANMLATRDGRAVSVARAVATVNVFPSFGRLTYRGEVIVFEWRSPSFSKLMRVLAVKPGNQESGDYTLVMIEDQFATGLRTSGEVDSTSHVDPGAGLDVAPPSAEWNDAEFPPDGLRFNLILTNTNQFQGSITGGIVFGTYASGGQYARLYVTEPGGVQTLSPARLLPDGNNEAIFNWPALAVGTYEFCVQTFSLHDATNGVKVCAEIDIAAIGSPSISPSSSASASASPSVSPSSSESPSPSASVSPSSSTSPSVSSSVSSSPSPSSSVSPSVSPSSSSSPSTSPSSSDSPSLAVFQPDDITGLDWWLVGDDATINGVPQFDWPDRSSANLPYGQNTSTNEPTLVSGPNGHQLVQFGLNKWLVPDPSSRTLGVANTLIVVCSKSTSPDYIISGTEVGIHGSPAIISGFSGDFEYYNDFGSGNVERTAFAASTDSNLHVLIITRTDDTGNYSLYFDGGSPITGAVNNNCDWNGLAFSRIGSQHTVSSSNYTGKIAEILHWPSVLSKTDLNDLLTYFGTEYSISVTPIP